MSKVKKSKKNLQEDTLCPFILEENTQLNYINKLPTKIVGTYTDDYDINYINHIILSTLNQEKNKLIHLENQLKKLKSLSETIQTYISKKETIKEIEEITKEIENINKSTKLYQYKLEAEPLLEQYKLHKSNVEERLKIINDFLKLARKYIIIQVTRQLNYKTVCVSCKISLDDMMCNDGMIRCPNCNYEYRMINATKYTDNNLQHINTENDDENFAKALMRYQGLQNNPSKALYEKLDVYFKERGFPDAASIKLMPYDDRGRKGNTNKKMLCTALSSIGYASYYEDVNLIGHIYWDWKLPDLTHLKDLIMKHYMITQKSFYKIPTNVRQRISSLGTQYRLWRHLQLVGHICYMDDFKIAENNDSLQNHHRLWKMMCQLSDHEEIYYID